MGQAIVEAPAAGNLPALGHEQMPSVGVEAKDIQISTLFLLQKTSPLCDEDPDLKPGMILDSVSKNQVGNTQDGLMFIPLSYKKDWVIMRKEGDQYKWFGFDEYNADTANLSWNWEEDGVAYRRDERISFFCLLPDQIDAELSSKDDEDFDPDNVVLPVRICFKRTSYAAGKILLTFFAKVEEARRRKHIVPYYHSIFNLKSRMEKNKESQSYQVFDVEKICKTPANQKGICEQWTKQMAERSVKVDESIEMDAQQPGQPIKHTAPVDNAAAGVADQF